MTFDMHADATFAARTRLAAMTAAMAMLSACAAAPIPSASPPPTGSPSATGSAETASTSSAVDLTWLVDELERSHPAPFHAVDRETFVAALDDLESRLPRLTPEEALVETMRVWAMLSRDRDGHQFALAQDAHAGEVLPIRLYEFAEGVYVTDAMPPHQELVGARIVALGSLPMDEVLAAVEPLVPRDGPQTVPAHRPILLLEVDVLRGLDIVADPTTVAVEVEPPDGARRTVELTPVSADAHAAFALQFGRYRLPLDERVTYLASSESFSATLLGDGTAYLRYRFVEPMSLDEVRAWIDADEVRRLVLDLRQNPGGNNGTYGALRDLVTEWAEAHPGTLTVLTDRVTFSAASNLATEIEQRTDARFVGEAMGGAPNFWNDVRWVAVDDLPIPMRLGVSTVAWQFAPADDPRLTLDPDVAIEVTAADFFAGRDPALDAVLAPGN
jgi:hypothetical protein